MASTAYCHWGKLGSVVLGSVFDDVQDPKPSVKTEKGGVGEYESILIRPLP